MHNLLERQAPVFAIDRNHLHGLGCPAEKRNPMQRLLVHVGNVPGNVRRKKKRFPSRLVLTKNHDALAGYRNVLKTPHLKL